MPFNLSQNIHPKHPKTIQNLYIIYIYSCKDGWMKDLPWFPPCSMDPGVGHGNVWRSITSLWASDSYNNPCEPWFKHIQGSQLALGELKTREKVNQLKRCTKLYYILPILINSICTLSLLLIQYESITVAWFSVTWAHKKTGLPNIFGSNTCTW